jgi:amino acid transporter
MTAAGEAGLVRGIRRWDLVLFAVNATIGAGIFGLPSTTYRLVGSYSLVAFVLCALVAGLIMFCFAEVASRFDRTGGVYLYAREAFGSTVGFELGWLLWLQRITGFAVLSNLFVAYFAFFWPAAAAGIVRALVIATIGVVLTIVNIRGVSPAARFGNLFTLAKLVPLLVFIAVGLFFVEPSRLALGPPPGLAPLSSSVLLLVFAFAGYDMTVIPAGETQDPRRNLPFALFTAQLVISIIYILVQVVSVGTLPGLGESDRPLADASLRFLGPFGAWLISIGAMISTTGTILITVLAAPRVLFALGEQGQLPGGLAALHPRFRTPHVAILITSAVMLLVAISGTFVYAVTINAMIRLTTYFVTCGAFLVFRARPNAPPASYRAPAGGAVALLSMGLCVWLLAHSTAREARDLTIAALIGLVVHGLYLRRGRAA